MELNFSKRVRNLKPSAIREIFKYAEMPEYIPFSAGNPAAEAFPAEEIGRISAEILRDSPVAALQYSTTEGYRPLREYLKEYMREKYGVGGNGDSLLITSGAQQTVDLVTKALVDPGDIVLCEAPSFIGSLNSFRSFEAALLGIPMDEDGVNTERLESVLRENKNIKYFYTIPNFQNPSGITMSAEKRKKVYELCSAAGVLILEDNPYGDLRFRGEDIPAIKTLDTAGAVMYVGSFSKVVSPGIRVGYAIGPEALIHKMVVCKQGEDVHTNIWAQMICHRFMTECDYEAHLERLRGIYKHKAEVLEEAMRQYLAPKGISWSKFDGGLFAWCKLPEGVDMSDYVQQALEHKVCVVPGSAFMPNENEVSDCFRVNFSTPTDGQLRRGIEILGSI